MKIAIVGSRNISSISIENYVTKTDEIVSGGARGVDTLAANYAKQHGLKLTEFLPEYERYGRAAPILRNQKIVNYSDKIIVFWDGKSKGTLSVINYAKKIGKAYDIIICG
ncbi:MAG: DUF2493 domain-containing protein [Clostridia bacterium]|nr:DUF2493 domain-containing protein [Clostridia bacterium]